MKIKIDKTTCQLCGSYADWDTSYGKKNYIICGSCYRNLNARTGACLDIIFAMADVRTDRGITVED